MKASTEAPEIAMPYGVPDSFGEHIKLQFDLLTLAYQADITASRRFSMRATLRVAYTRRAARTSASTAARTMRKIRAASRSTRS